ncbi:MAG: hypothetical protein IIA41_04150, partial [SAR324 cluster bacterium]|nr:hypothetical protein [SAR324 cluster bacterium]
MQFIDFTRDYKGQAGDIIIRSLRAVVSGDLPHTHGDGFGLLRGIARQFQPVHDPR